MASEPFIYKDLANCRDILSGRDLNDSNFGPVLTLLDSRAGPNERLIQAFGIDNAFTTRDNRYHKQFRQHAQSLLKVDERGWENLKGVAQVLVQQGVRRAAKANEILLVPFVQTVTLKVALHLLFSLDIEGLPDSAIQVIAEKINALWIDSKQQTISNTRRSDQNALREALKMVIPHSEHPRDNPLNLILPAYETLWRVVLRCFVEVTFRSGSAGHEWRQNLLAFLECPNQHNFEDARASGVSVDMVVAEALRLYPPTRRIYRHVKPEFAVEVELVAADVESLQRDPRIWGEDSLQFRPSRWIGIRRSSQNAYMPFGWRPLVCPARKEFGPKMIGLLVAAFVVGFLDGWGWKAATPEDAIDGDGPLRSDRESFKTLALFQLRR
ncbi:MAG: hypothetical protein M1816_005924 [Peltula sp. TS41687]|nr:MAG: hypothetical protein M1816_005924 [Peltula sp. TS41687]